MTIKEAAIKTLKAYESAIEILKDGTIAEVNDLLRDWDGLERMGIVISAELVM